MASFQYGGPSSMGKPSFSGGGGGGSYRAPDTYLTYTNLDHEDSLYGANGYDPSRAFKGMNDIFGGGGGNAPRSYQYGAGGSLGAGGASGSYTGAINRGRSSGGVGGNIPTLTSRGAAQTRAALATAPYQYEMEAQAAGHQQAMQLAQMQAKAQMAAEMMRLQAAREERMMMMQDNERNRMAQLEQQRRGALADQYGVQQQNYYQYGLGV